MPKVYSRRRNNILFGVLCAVLFYVILSGAIAWTTLDACGGSDAPKDWRFVPPGWECRNDPFRP